MLLLMLILGRVRVLLSAAGREKSEERVGSVVVEMIAMIAQSCVCCVCVER